MRTAGDTEFWTTEKVEYIKANYGKRSAAVIAHDLGCTRNAVVGKAGRLKLSSSLINGTSDGSTRTHAVPNPQPLKRRTDGSGILRHIRSMVDQSANPAAPEMGDVILDLPNLWSDPSRTGVSFADLEPHHCRWPLDSGLYCGDPKAAPYERDGRVIKPSYCKTHQHASVNHDHRYKRGIWASPKL